MKNVFAVVGIQAKRRDFANFFIGMLLPPILLFLMFFFLKHNGTLENTNYLTLLLNGKRKLLYYWTIGFIEEFLFRGIVFGLVCKKMNNIIVSILLSAAI